MNTRIVFSLSANLPKWKTFYPCAAAQGVVICFATWKFKLSYLFEQIKNYDRMSTILLSKTQNCIFYAKWKNLYFFPLQRNLYFEITENFGTYLSHNHYCSKSVSWFLVYLLLVSIQLFSLVWSLLPLMTFVESFTLCRSIQAFSTWLFQYWPWCCSQSSI